MIGILNPTKNAAVWQLKTTDFRQVPGMIDSNVLYPSYIGWISGCHWCIHAHSLCGEKKAEKQEKQNIAKRRVSNSLNV